MARRPRTASDEALLRNHDGCHEIQGLENQILVLLFMSWSAADQYIFYRKNIVASGAAVSSSRTKQEHEIGWLRVFGVIL